MSDKPKHILEITDKFIENKSTPITQTWLPKNT
jgi:hypothetical protein